MNNAQVEELLYQALETEQGGQKVYTAAIECARNKDLNEEWKKYLDETTNHERILLDVFRQIGLDPERETPGRKVVRGKAEGLVKAMSEARAAGKPEAAELVAAECVVEAETKDHQNWELIGRVADASDGTPPQRPPAGVRTSRGRGRRAPLPHHGLGQGTLDQVARHACRPPTSGRGEEGQDRDRRRPGRAKPGGDDPPLTSSAAERTKARGQLPTGLLS